MFCDITGQGCSWKPTCLSNVTLRGLLVGCSTTGPDHCRGGGSTQDVSGNVLNLWYKGDVMGIRWEIKPTAILICTHSHTHTYICIYNYTFTHTYIYNINGNELADCPIMRFWLKIWLGHYIGRGYAGDMFGIACWKMAYWVPHDIPMSPWYPNSNSSCWFAHHLSAIVSAHWFLTPGAISSWFYCGSGPPLATWMK